MTTNFNVGKMAGIVLRGFSSHYQADDLRELQENLFSLCFLVSNQLSTVSSLEIVTILEFRVLCVLKISPGAFTLKHNLPIIYVWARFSVSRFLSGFMGFRTY